MSSYGRSIMTTREAAARELARTRELDALRDLRALVLRLHEVEATTDTRALQRAWREVLAAARKAVLA